MCHLDELLEDVLGNKDIAGADLPGLLLLSQIVLRGDSNRGNAARHVLSLVHLLELLEIGREHRPAAWHILSRDRYLLLLLGSRRLRNSCCCGGCGVSVFS